MAAAFDCDVLVVGAGPVGVLTAILLAQQGVDVIVTDKAEDIYPLPRAAHIDHETMRILQAAGVADAVAAASRPAAVYDFLTVDRQVLMRFESDPVNSASGWPSANMIHQPSIERVLRERLAKLTNARLRAGVVFTSLKQDGDGVRAVFGDGTEIRARYLIGCDGAASAVRQTCDVKQFDYRFDEPWLVIDVLAPDPTKLPTVNLQICDPARPTTCVLMAPGRHRWEFMLLPGETAETALDDAFIARCLAPWNVADMVTLERKAVYRFHALVAERWRTGRVFLAGDAAHQMPPFAGQGLCSGLRDGANLAWKIAAVLRGEAGDALLDTYQIEREPHVRAITEMALMMGRTVCISDPAAAAARDAAMLAQRAQQTSGAAPVSWPPFGKGCLVEGAPGAGEVFPQPVVRDSNGAVRLDDILGPGWWLIATHAAATNASASAVRVLTLDEPKLAPYRLSIGQWLDRRGAAAVLVRPDRCVFATGDPGNLLIEMRQRLQG